MDPTLPLLLLVMMSAGLAIFNQRLASPFLAICNRWLRWVLFAIVGAWAAGEYGWSDRPEWLVGLTLFLLWFLIESLYNWLAVAAVSQSTFALFPQFSVNHDGDEWPASPAAIRLRDMLRAERWRKIQSLKAEIGPDVILRVSVFHHPGLPHRIQVYFIPQPGGAPLICESIQSLGDGGSRHITDNLTLPFGGFYPEEWYVERRPLTRDLHRLLRRHERRLGEAGVACVPWNDEPLEDMNRQQQLIERVNIELGFLFPGSEHEEHGRITREGRYRVWKEIWMLSYLGLPRIY